MDYAISTNYNVNTPFLEGLRQCLSLHKQYSPTQNNYETTLEPN